MSDRRLLRDELHRYSDSMYKRFGSSWKELEMGWTSNHIIDQFVREAGFMYHTMNDFTRWLDNYYESTIAELLKGQRKAANA